MIALTMVMLASAFNVCASTKSLRLHPSAVMSSVFMIWLVTLFVVLIVQILGRRQQLFWLGCLGSRPGFVFTLNVMIWTVISPATTLARFDKTGKLDVSYLLSLSDDALPPSRHFWTGRDWLMNTTDPRSPGQRTP